MFKKISTFLLSAIMTVSLAACGTSNAGPENTQQPSESSVVESSNTEAEKPSTEGTVADWKKYEIRRTDNDYCMVWLRYRENSDYVAEVTFQMKVPKDFSDYEGVLSDNQALESKISSQNISTSLIEFADAELADGLETSIKFNGLDEGNPNVVALAEEYVDLPTQNGYLRLGECEQFLLDNGFELTDQRAY